MQIYRRYPDEKGNTDISELVDPKSLRKESPQAMDLSRPTLFFFPGFQTMDDSIPLHPVTKKPLNNQDSYTSLNLKSSVVESHLGNAADLYRQGKVNFYTLTYSPTRIIPKRIKNLLVDAYNVLAPDVIKIRRTTPRSGKLFDAASFMFFPEVYYREDAEHFVDQMILPAIMRANGSFLPKDEIMEKFRNVTFAADSYGSTFAHQIGNYLKFCLTKNKKHPKGFPAEEVKEMLQQFVFIGGSNIVINDKPGQKNPFTGIYFEGRGDQFIAMARRLENMRSLILPHLLSGKRFPETINHEEEYNGMSKLSDSGYYEMANEQIHVIEAAERHYKPTPDKDNTTFRPVDKGMVVEFDVPTRFHVLLKDHGKPLARFYPNVPELHQSYSYYYPIPEHRDHADLYGRALRNAVTRSPKEEVTAQDLLTRDVLPHKPKNGNDESRTDFTSGINQARMKAHLDEVVAKQLAEVRGEKVGMEGRNF